MSLPLDESLEWLEADGLGGFASGTVAGPRTRRYHALLLTATTPPTGRMVLVNGFDAWVQTPNGQYAITSQRYAPEAVYPDGAWHIESFDGEPWPCWRFRLADGTRVAQELFVPAGTPAIALAWRLIEPRAGVVLHVRPFLSGRDYHSLHHENPAFRHAPEVDGERLVWRPYQGVPAILSVANAAYAADPSWYRNFLYKEEAERGLDATEDLASPGTLTWDLSAGEAAWLLAAGGTGGFPVDRGRGAMATVDAWRDAERTRRRHPTRLHRAADAYLVQRQRGETIIAGYPWFTDWGRDTFIALRGLCLAGGRLDDARAILLAWAGTVSEGMLPNRFPDHGEPPEFNSVDASLWYVVAVHEFLGAPWRRARRCRPREEQALRAAVEAILDGYAARHALRHPLRRRRPARAPASPACSSPGWTPRSATGW